MRWAITVLGCAQFVLSYIAIRFFFRLDAYAAGHAGLPFQYRVFPMLVMRVFEHVGLLVRVGARMPVEEPSVYALVDAGLAFAAILVAVWATHQTVLHLTSDRSIARWFPLLLLPMCHANLANSWGLNYTAPYDVPAVAFFCVGVWLIVTGQLAWLYPVFFLATLNRETSIFLVLFYAVWAWAQAYKAGPLPNESISGPSTSPSAAKAEFFPAANGTAEAVPLTRQRFWKLQAFWPFATHAAVLAAIWVVTKVVLAHVYPADASRGDVAFDSHLLQNLKQIVEPQQWPVLLSVCAFALPVLWLGRRWIRNDAYSRAMVVTMAAWFAGMMVVGTIVEIRIFAEWAAFVVPALAMMARNWFNMRTSSEPMILG